jgi:hypothetical protein
MSAAPARLGHPSDLTSFSGFAAIVTSASAELTLQ